jgi:hypothetical protein
MKAEPKHKPQTKETKPAKPMHPAAEKARAKASHKTKRGY